MGNVRQVEREVRRRQLLYRPSRRALQCLKHQTQRLLLSQSKSVSSVERVIDMYTDGCENLFPLHDGTQLSPVIRVRIHEG